jgi:hypothetical protein
MKGVTRRAFALIRSSVDFVSPEKSEFLASETIRIAELLVIT